MQALVQALRLEKPPPLAQPLLLALLVEKPLMLALRLARTPPEA